MHEHVDFMVYDLLDARDIPSWEFYAEVAQDEVAPYRIEEAPSSRSHCSMHGKKVPKHAKPFSLSCVTVNRLCL